MDIRAIARTLGGDVVGRSQALAPGPGHSPRDRSLAVWLDPQAPNGFRVHSHGGDDWQACREHVREALGLPEPRRISPHQRTHSNLEQRVELAARIWDEARPIGNTLAATYLCTRGVDISPSWPDCLRFHPACPRGRERQPALVAGLVDVETNDFRAISRRFLTPAGAADGKPYALGPSRQAAVKLSAEEDVTLALGLAEGIETALSLLAIGWAPIWACGGTATLADFPVLAGIEALTIFADNDESGAGLKAALACAERYQSAGREVRILRPRLVGNDFNDALR